MAPGEVEILPFEGADDIAQYVAFAASVKGNSSSAEAIEKIGAALGDFTRSQVSVRTASAPLFGAGAGGIQSEKVVAALKSGFIFRADPTATLVIHVLHKDVYERLKGNRRVIQGKAKETVRVFISHTSKSEAAVEWVKALALYLIEQGVQARLDKFHLRRGMDLPQVGVKGVRAVIKTPNHSLIRTRVGAAQFKRWAHMTELAKLSKRTSGAVLKEREQ